MARKDIAMNDEERLAFLEHPHTLQVASIGADGYPHIAPMWYVVDDGKITFRSFTKSQKIVNLRRNPKLSVLAESGKAYTELRGVLIRGTARFVTDRDYIVDLYGRLAARYPMFASEPVPLDPEALEAAFGRHAEKNTAVIVEPDKVASWDHSKLGGTY